MIFIVFAGFAATASAADVPRSVIPWLSESLSRDPGEVSLPDYDAGLGGDTVTPFEETGIITSALDDPIRDGYGLLTATETGFPQALWGNTSALRVRSLILSRAPSGVPAARQLYRDMLLAETDPPPGSGPGSTVLLARIDALMAMGDLSAAKALIARAGDNDPAVFRRSFDIALLTGEADQACARLRGTPSLSPTLPARVYCLALGDDWNAAALTLKLGHEVGNISTSEEELLAWFLDPQLFEGAAPPPAPSPLTTLDFILREAVALPRPDGPLPLAFTYPDTHPSVPLRQRIEAMERLVKLGAMPADRLIEAYRSAKPAASGGVWDHMDMIQKLDAAFAISEPARTAEALQNADLLFADLGLRHAFAETYARQLAALDPFDFDVPTQRRIYRLLLLAGNIAGAAPWIPDNGDVANRFFKVLATGSTDLPASGSLAPLKTAVAAGLTAEEITDETGALILSRFEQGHFGEALLKTLDLLAAGPEVDPGDLTTALVLLRKAGLEDRARLIAFQTLLLLPEA